MDDRLVADYFVVAGLAESENERVEEDSFGSHQRQSLNETPITDLAVIFPSYGETVPHEFTPIKTTPTGLSADLNHGSLRSPEVFLCYRRGKDKPPLVDIGIMYEGKERILPDSEIVLQTPHGRPANVNNSTAKTYVTYRRASPTQPCNALVVTDICVVIASKGESPPHAFCVINKNLNKGMVGSDVFLCYKKSMNQAPSITYKPVILSRYPISDRKSFPLPQSVPLFCLPMGATLEAWPTIAQQPPPVFSTFVLTVSDAAQKVYGSAVTFYEDYPEEKINNKLKERLRSSSVSNKKDNQDNAISYHAIKCVCLLSHWPFFDAFEKFLLFLYNMSREGSYPIPIERYILHFMENVPFPSAQRPRILVQLSPSDRVIFTQPEDLPLPRSGAGFHQMLMNLGPDNCLLLLLCALTEQKLLIHSLRADVLTAVAEAVAMIIFPFKWQCPYIPLCPLTLAEVLHAPVPFLIGVDSRFFDLYDPPSDVNCVDLDTNNITLCEEKKYLSTKLLPKKAARALRSTLEQTYQNLSKFFRAVEHYNENNKDLNIDRDFTFKRKEQSLELEIQEAFLKFMVHILKEYRSFLLPITKAPTVGATDTNSLFNLQGFLRTRDKSYQKFYSLLTRTQMFIRFIEERSFVSDLDAGLAFFDECVDKMEQDEYDIHLLELDESHQSERTVFVSPPEQNGLPHSTVPSTNYTYQGGFKLNPMYFSQSQKISRSFSDANCISAVPGSPLARRTKYEIKSAQKLALKYSISPDSWAKCLLSTCFSLWFIHMPSYVLFTEQNVSSTLGLAYELLLRIQKSGLQPIDEVCYRVMMQLCGVYNQPVLAVKLLSSMKRIGVQPNAITYGFYNRAVLESKWPSDIGTSSKLLWNKLRNVVRATALLRQMGQEAGKRRMSIEEASVVDGSRHHDILTEIPKNMNTVLGKSDECEENTVTESRSASLEGAEPSEFETIGSLESSELVTDDLVTDSDDELETYIKGRRSSAITSRDIATLNRFCSRMGSIVKSTGMPLRNQNTGINQQPYESSAGLLMTGGVTISSFPESDSKLAALDKTSSVFSSPQRVRGNNRSGKRARSGSCSEFISSSPPRNARPYSYYQTQNSNSKSTAHDASDCYQLLVRSESFANDAQILKNLQEIKSQKAALALNEINGKTISYSRTVQSNAIALNQNNHASFRKAMLGMKKLQEYPNSESQNSSLETLPSSGIGSVESIANKRAVTPPCDETRRRDDNRTPVSLKSPVRTPVTENDPLGALLVKEDECDASHTETQASQFNHTNSQVNHAKIELDDAGAPMLFDRRRWEASDVRRSIGSGLDVVSDETRSVDKARSNTLPADERGSPFKTGLGSLSHIKLPFSKYSPSRFSLRKSDIRLGTQMLENAFSSLSPSSLPSKNELFMGGLSSLKNAASSMAKKIDEIKEAMSVNTTPSKNGIADDCLEDELTESLNNTSIEETPVKRKISNEFSPSSVTQQWSSNLMEFFSEGSRKGSTSNLQTHEENSSSSSQQSLTTLNDKLYPKVNRNARVPIALELIMTTCSKCHHCCALIYDEEIMAGWLPEDSNLNTKCPFCDKATVPFLYVTVVDYRSSSETASRFTSQESISSSLERVRRKSSFNKLNNSINSIGGSHVSVDSSAIDEDPKLKNVHTLEPIIVPYLNPLVLRKELENILNTEGDSCLTRSTFVDEHPIIYWNMVWVFERIGASSHVTGLCLHSNCVIGNRDVTLFHSSWSGCDYRNVLVRTLWDNPNLHDEVGYPMYMLWNKNDKESDLLSALLTDNTTIPKSLMERVISSVHCNELSDPVKRVAAERLKLKSHGINHNYSLYRDILFLTFIVLGRENIDHSAFDQEYMDAIESLTKADLESKMYMRCDQPPRSTLSYFRYYFKELEL